MMTSTGLPVFNTEAEVAQREPTDKDMMIISVKEAGKLFGSVGSRIEGVSVSSMRGIGVLSIGLTVT